MSQYGSWSVKGVDDRARAVAKEKARLKGVTLGDYINNLLLEGHSEAGPRDLPYAPYSGHGASHAPSASAAHPGALDSLAQRIEAVEARSTLAITGIDQSVLGMLARLEGTENSSAAMAAEVEAMVDELRETHETLVEKVSALEEDDSGVKGLAAMKALEDALGKLAAHVYVEGRLTHDESAAIKGRVEAGCGDLNERVEGMEVKVESTLASAAQRVEKAVEQAELRAEGTSRHLSERFTAIESSVATKLSKVDEVDARMIAVEGDVSGAITSMESTVMRIQERLGRAEMTTDTALKALEQTFSNLDERIDHVAELASPEKAEALRQEFERRFDSLASDLRTSVEHSRQQLADEIERAAAGATPELMGELSTRVAALETQDPAGLVDTLGDQVSQLSETLDQRIVDSERRSAAAIEQVGEQVASAIKQVQARQDHNQRNLEQKVDAANKAQASRLSDALNNVSDRLAEMKTQTATAVSPVQKAIVSLASRLEALEDFSAPPMAENKAEALPDMPELSTEVEPITLPAEPEPAPTPAIEESSFTPTNDLMAEMNAPADEEDYDFIAGLPDFDDESDAVSAEAEIDANATDPMLEDEDWSTTEADDDYAAIEDPVAEPDTPAEATFDPLETDAPVPAEEPDFTDADPLAELGSWDDAQQEARESDIFSEDDPNEALSTFDPEAEEAEALAHNIELEEELELEAEEALSEDENLLVPDEDATDYLSRARKAAIAAATDPSKDSKSRRGRRSAASTTPKPASGGGRKLPVIAAASAFAIAAAGAGGWVALRGKINFSGNDGPAITTASNIAETQAEAAAPAVEEPSLTGIEFAEADAAVDETLFEEEGSVSGTPEVEPVVEEPAPVEAAPYLPEVPKALSLERAAIEGNPVAQFKWGEARLEANDFAAGADFVRRAARQGLPAAQYRLAKLHERGVGVPRDLFEARSWTEKAASGGNTKAMHDLAVFFADGEGGAQSYAAAAEWFRKAADYGVVDSQYNLAVLYENGLGISPSQAEALYWYEVASINGDASAPGNVATLREALPLEQAQSAQRRASGWTKTPEIAAANGRFDLQNWQRSERAQVSAVQTVLNGLGYEAGTPDGIAGPGTRTAVRAYQADNGLETNGLIDEALVETMNRQTQGLAG